VRIELLGDAYHYEIADIGVRSSRAPVPADTVLFLHGFAQSADSWTPVVRAMADAAVSVPLRLVLLDLIGHGQSAKPHVDAPYQLEHIVEMLDALRTAVAPPTSGGRFHVVGYSMGGRIALAYAAEHAASLTSLVLESASFGPRSADERAAFAERDRALAERLRVSTPEEFAAWWAEMPVLADQSALPTEVRAAEQARRAANDTDALARVTLGAGQAVMPDLYEAVGGMGIPLLYVCGEHDERYSSIAAAAQARWGLDVARFDTGHNVHLASPKEFAELLLGFFADQRSER
jgi:2-succinyl-6-hydroxy-2,4-cyclohexadiene-1-carboxylate synthase